MSPLEYNQFELMQFILCFWPDMKQQGKDYMKSSRLIPSHNLPSKAVTIIQMQYFFPILVRK